MEGNMYTVVGFSIKQQQRLEVWEMKEGVALLTVSKIKRWVTVCEVAVQTSGTQRCRSMLLKCWGNPQWFLHKSVLACNCPQGLWSCMVYFIMHSCASGSEKPCERIVQA